MSPTSFRSRDGSDPRVRFVATLAAAVGLGVAVAGCKRPAPAPSADPTAGAPGEPPARPAEPDRTRPSPTDPAATPPTPSAAPRPGERAGRYDPAKIPFDPFRPDLTIAANVWPRRTSNADTSLTAYYGKVIATEGRIIGLNGSESEVSGAALPAGQVRVSVFLFDPGGKYFDGDGRGVFATVSFSPHADWTQFRPGQVVRAVGRAVAPFGGPTSVSLVDAAPLGVYPDVPAGFEYTPDTLPAVFAANPRRFSSGSTLDQAFTLTGVVAESRVPPPANQSARVVFGDARGRRFECTLKNARAATLAPPVVGRPATVIARVISVPAAPQPVLLEGILLPP